MKSFPPAGIQWKLQEELRYEKDLLCYCQRRLGELPSGSLYQKGETPPFRYYQYDNGRQIYLGNTQSEIVLQLKDANLLREMVKRLRCDIVLIETALRKFRNYDPNYLESTFRPAYQHIASSTFRQLGFPDASSNWSVDLPALSARNSAGRYEESLRCLASDGTRLRSRGELLIYESYLRKGIPVEYEREVLTPSGHTMHPDFTGYCSEEHERKYHEHLGNLADPKYRETQFWKVDQYIEAGFYPGQQILFTCDAPDGSLDMEAISYQIDAFYHRL